MATAPAIHELTAEGEPGLESALKAAVDRADALAQIIGPRAAAVAFLHAATMTDSSAARELLRRRAVELLLKGRAGKRGLTRL